MGGCVRQLCLLAVLFGVILDITPEGSVKRVSCIVCSAALIMTVLSGIRTLDIPGYGIEAARYREISDSLARNAEESGERLSRLVIQSECEEYIMDKAALLGITDISAKVTARWNSDGFWMPETVTLKTQCEADAKERLSDIIETELGVGKGNQIWNS